MVKKVSQLFFYCKFKGCSQISTNLAHVQAPPNHNSNPTLM